MKNMSIIDLHNERDDLHYNLSNIIVTEERFVEY